MTSLIVDEFNIALNDFMIFVDNDEFCKQINTVLMFDKHFLIKLFYDKLCCVYKQEYIQNNQEEFVQSFAKTENIITQNIDVIKAWNKTDKKKFISFMILLYEYATLYSSNLC